MDTEAIAIAVLILVLLGELAWAVHIIGHQYWRIKVLECDLETLEEDLRTQVEVNHTIAAIALALEKEEDPADWWKCE